MRPIVALATILWIVGADVAVAGPPCADVSDLATARARWAQARQAFGSARSDNSCRTSSVLFWEAVTTRHLAAICEEGAARQRDLSALDSDVDALNDTIAAQCRPE
jgi:hypothetical protein